MATTSKYGPLNLRRNRGWYVTDHAAWRWKQRMPAGHRSIYTAFERAQVAYSLEQHGEFHIDQVRVYSAVSPHGEEYDAVLLVDEGETLNRVVTTYRIDSIEDGQLAGFLRDIGRRRGVIEE